MVGLPDTSVRESRERVRLAIRNSGFEYPPHRITVNLSPADVRKAGTSFDLPIALGILAASGVVERRHVADRVLLGELSLDGSIQAARGVLPIAAAARRDGLVGILLPSANAREAAIVSGLDIVAVSSLVDAVRALNDPAGFRTNPPALDVGTADRLHHVRPLLLVEPDQLELQAVLGARQLGDLGTGGGRHAGNVRQHARQDLAEVGPLDQAPAGPHP